ncbi:MAG: c-type cytochrome [Acidobacteria bacterium]|nr:c-type cytochrome [Acidobacteriota bacterium]
MWILVVLAAAFPLAAQVSPYRIERAPSRITLDARLDEPAWRDATPVGDFIFNWFESGDREQTDARMLWDDDNLYVSWRCQDRHISAQVTERHGPVSRDDCVEIFISPNPAKVRNYYTFEINVIGTMLNRCRTDWWTGPPTWEPEGVQYRTTYHGRARKDESSDDREWIVELAIPLRNFARDAAHMPPRDGDEWRLNLQRTGGITNRQNSTWAPIAPPSKSFHTPESFGRVIFSTQVAAAPNAEAGRKLYNANCTACHGLDGAAGDRAPALGAQRRYLRRTEAELFDAIKAGIAGTLMPASPLPDSQVREIVGYIRSIRATAIDFAAPGDAALGREVFAGKGNCAACHMIGGRGGIIGPDLSNIAAERKYEDLRAALTVAKPVPPRGFQPVRVTLRDGRRVRGVIKNENNFSLQVLGTDDKLHLIDRSQAASVEYEKQSLMPADYGKKLTPAELTGVLAYLSTQSRRRAE